MPRNARAASMPTTTPVAVSLLGLPEPPSCSGMQVVWRVVAKTSAMSGVVVPASSAVT